VAITSADVAREAGVSRAVVSQVLNGRGDRFTEDTRVRVREAVSALGYRPSAAGRALARGSSDVVVALIPDTTFGGNLQTVFDTLTEELAKRGLILVLRLSTPSISLLDQLVASLQPRAVLSLTSFSEAERELLTARGVDAIDPGSASRNSIDREIGSLQARHLLARGHRRLGYAHLQDSRNDPFGTARELGFAAVARTHGLDAPIVVRLDIEPTSAGRALASLGRRGIAVGCYNDDVATALLSVAAAEGWSTPGELALIGMDATPLSRLTRPALTTIDFDMSGAARGAVAAILRNFDGQTVDEENTHEHRELRLELIAGGTT